MVRIRFGNRLRNTDIDATERLRITCKAFNQLREEECVRISANPFSHDYQFVLEVIYALAWGKSSSETSIMSSLYLSEDIPPEQVIITITLTDYSIMERIEQVIIKSDWKHYGAIISAENTCNNEIISTDEFSVSSEKYPEAVSMLKKVVRESLIYTYKKRSGLAK